MPSAQSSVLIADQRLDYEDMRFPFGSRCACRLRVWHNKGDYYVVMATELEPSPGASVTNTAERWAEEACKLYQLDPKQTTFVENYDRRESKKDPSFPDETFDLITFEWDGFIASEPKWKHAGRPVVEALIGDALP